MVERKLKMEIEVRLYPYRVIEDVVSEGEDMGSNLEDAFEYHIQDELDTRGFHIWEEPKEACYTISSWVEERREKDVEG